MSGHSHFATIKRKKEIADQKRGQLFSKLLNAVSVAAKSNPDVEFNPRLRVAIEKAKDNKVPQENIERSVKRASSEKNLEELIIEAYGPEALPIIIEAISDNKNRTIAEIKKILSDHKAKFAESGSVRWAFEFRDGEWQPKFQQEVSKEARSSLKDLVSELEERGDVQKVYTSI